MVRLSKSATRRPDVLGLALGVVGVALGTLLSVRNDATAASLLLTGLVGIAVGIGVGFLTGRVFAVAVLVVIVGGLLLHLRYAGSVAPLWPFVVLLGLTVQRQLPVSRAAAASTGRSRA